MKEFVSLVNSLSIVAPFMSGGGANPMLVLVVCGMVWQRWIYMCLRGLGGSLTLEVLLIDG